MENKEIDLKRMQELLNGFDNGKTHVDYKKEINTDVRKDPNAKLNNTSKDFCNLKVNKPGDGNDIDSIDRDYVLNKKGRVSGYSNIIDTKYLYEDIVQNIPIDDFKNAKTIIFSYIVNPEVSMFVLGDVMDKLHNDFIGESEVIFGTSCSDDLSVNEIGFKILLAGIEDDKLNKPTSDEELDLIFHRQLCNDNHLLKNKVSDLEIKIKRLESQKKRLEMSLLALK